MKMYFLICGVMLFVSLFKFWVEFNEYCRTHPGIAFEEGKSLPKRVFTLFQLYFYFCIPIVNVILFVYFVFLADDKIYIKEIEKKIVK